MRENENNIQQHYPSFILFEQKVLVNNLIITLTSLREVFTMHIAMKSKHMMKLKPRPCPECRGEMRPQLINLVYTKEQCDLHIEVIGIPAHVCIRCFYRIIPGKVAKYLDTLVDPIFESAMQQQEKILPTPHIDIQFPPVERAAYAY